MKKIAIIGATQFAKYYFDKARQMGVETHCFAWASGSPVKNFADYFYDISITEKEKIADICKNIGINGVIPVSEITIPTANYVAEKLGLIGNPYDISKDITDKYRNRLVTKDVDNLYHPAFKMITKYEELVALDFNYPIIIKPTARGGKRGISVVKNREDLLLAYNYAMAEIKDRECPLIVEEYIEGGQEYSVESLSYCGDNYIIQVTEKDSSGPPHCVELGHHQPAAISTEMRLRIEKVISIALSRIGLVNGPCHTEIKIKDGKIYLIEFNPRCGGDNISHPLVYLSTGFDYLKAVIEIALGEFKGIDTRRFLKRYAGICFITKETEYLKPVFDNCEKYEWCYEKHKVKDEIESLLHNGVYSLNYFMYATDKGKPDFKALSLELSKKK